MKIDKKTIILIGSIIILTIIFIMLYKFQIANKDINTATLLIIEGVIILISVLLMVVSNFIIKKKEFKPEKALLCIAPIFCIIFSIVMPVGRGHDEYMHWVKAYEVSEGTLITKIYDQKSLANLPEDALKIIVERPGQIFKYIDNLEMLNVHIDEGVRVYRDNRNAATYCFIQYIPQAVGIAFGRMITKVPILLSYFGRTFNMIACIILMYFAIKNIPFGKNIMLALSIIPITIEGFATLSADGITIAIACFFIGYVFKLIFDEKQKCGTKQIITLTMAGAVLALCKFVYLPIVFLALLIPKEKFNDKKEKIIAVTLIVLVAVVLNLSWLYVGSKALRETSPEATNTKFSQIITNPIGYVEKVIYTFTNNFDKYFDSCFGGQLEWDEKVKMPIIPYITCALVLLSTINETKLKNIFTKNQTIVIFLIVLAVTGLIFTSIFLQWTTNTIEINGVQGRYFLPILPLIMFLLGKIKIQTSYKYQNVTKMICIVGYLVMIYTAISVMSIHI